MLPATIGQKPMVATRHEFGSIIERYAIGWFSDCPLVQHWGGAVPSVSPNELCTINSVADSHIGECFRSTIGHQNRGASSEAITTCVRTSAIHIDGPLERHAAGGGDPVEDGLGFDLVEGDVAELGAVEGAHRGRGVEQGQVGRGTGLAPQVGEGLHPLTLERVFEQCKEGWGYRS